MIGVSVNISQRPLSPTVGKDSKVQ